MHIIEASDVNSAWAQGREFLLEYGQREKSRAGDVLVAPSPVTTVYLNPRRRVLFDRVRDANPFFHLMEALWMLAGRNDVEFLNRFVKDFGERFGESDGTMHGAYGHRWRKAFVIDGVVDDTGDYVPLITDQLQVLISKLEKNPHDRQAVLEMWNPCSDLTGDWKDRPCNTHAYFRRRDDYLDLTVCCRSNDIYWGAYGANAVHFSILLEYMAAMIGCKVGFYYQVSNNFHAYIDVLSRYEFERKLMSRGSGALHCMSYGPNAETNTYVRDLVADAGMFDRELELFLANPTEKDVKWNNPFFNIARYMYIGGTEWRNGGMYDKMRYMPSCDWKDAAEDWLKRRGKW